VRNDLDSEMGNSSQMIENEHYGQLWRTGIQLAFQE